MGFIHRGHRRMFAVTLRSFIIVVGFTLAVGLIGLAYGFLNTTGIERNEYHGWFIPPDVIHLRRYICVGYMHNASYIGGAIAILAAWIYHVIIRNRTKNT